MATNGPVPRESNLEGGRLIAALEADLHNAENPLAWVAGQVLHGGHVVGSHETHVVGSGGGTVKVIDEMGSDGIVRHHQEPVRH